MRSFLDAYHARQHRFIRADRLKSHSGAIVGAFVPKTSGSSFSTMNIELNMLNGQLPNLDLVNLMVRLADKFALVPTLYESSEYSTWSGIAEIAAKGAIVQVHCPTSLMSLDSRGNSHLSWSLCIEIFFLRLLSRRNVPHFACGILFFLDSEAVRFFFYSS